MFSLVKPVFIVILSFSEYLERKRTKFLSLNYETCIVRPILINLNPIELKYYPFMISLDECNGSFNVLSPKTFVPKDRKDINVKAFNMVTNKDESKKMAEHVSCDCK